MEFDSVVTSGSALAALMASLALMPHDVDGFLLGEIYHPFRNIVNNSLLCVLFHCHGLLQVAWKRIGNWAAVPMIDCTRLSHTLSNPRNAGIFAMDSPLIGILITASSRRSRHSAGRSHISLLIRWLGLPLRNNAGESQQVRRPHKRRMR